MPRMARVVFAGIPHHITQRGNRREDVFFSNDDRRKYLGWLKEYCEKYNVEILAYCLMTNHVHIVGVPREEDSFHRVFKPLHMRYAQRINRERDWRGHLWQGRFFSSPLDEEYLWATMRYIERNPVRAGIVARAEAYPWSSAAEHMKIRESDFLSRNPHWMKQLNQIKDWSTWLSGEDDLKKVKIIRRNIAKGLPCGSKKFISELEKVAGRMLSYRSWGRPRKQGRLEKG